MSVEPAAVRQPDMQVEPEPEPAASGGAEAAGATDSPCNTTMSVEDEEDEVSDRFQSQ